MEYTGERFVLGKAEGEIETEHLHRYNAIMEMASGKNILDIACGEGFGTAILARKAAHVWGVDISDEAINYAKERYNRYNLNYKQGSVENLDFEDDFFDMIVSFETIEHVDEVIQDKFLKETNRVLKNNGILVMSTPDKYLYSDVPNHRNPYHVKEFYFSEYKDFLEKQFKYVDFYNQNYSVYGLIANRNDDSKENIRLINTTNSQKQGKYIIAVCSNEELPKNISISSLYENPAVNIESEQNEDYLQLYWASENDGFNESKSRKAKFAYSDEFQTYCFKIPNCSIGKIRLDIGNRPSIFQIKKDLIFKFENEVALIPMNISDAIGLVRLNSDDTFIDFISMSDDPQLLLDSQPIEHKGELSIYIDLKINKFDFNLCLNEINSYLGGINNGVGQIDDSPQSISMQTEEVLDSSET
ncbi:class I SAM-dependent methyltransferase [Paenibacillus sp. FSL R7-0128]|uniref:class I SAM-dependent methyltransferase n=1 Tax=Paenibacillus sp. FSL R7-0128 TaxID=2954529 RepID=UPI0030F61506